MTRRSSIAAIAGFALFGQLLASQFNASASPKFLLWNASGSVPRGLYLLLSARPLHVGELVSVTPPTMLANFMAARGYVPPGVPLVKHIAALAGQTICRRAGAITIDKSVIATARDRDSHGRTLPSWRGCRRLRADEAFLLNVGVPDSFDGRYFGPLSTDTVTACAEPLWTLPES